MVGSEVYSSEIKKTEVLMENFRRAIGMCICNVCLVYAGADHSYNQFTCKSLICSVKTIKILLTDSIAKTGNIQFAEFVGIVLRQSYYWCIVKVVISYFCLISRSLNVCHKIVITRMAVVNK